MIDDGPGKVGSSVKEGSVMTVLDGVREILGAIPAIVAEDARLDEKHGIDSETGYRLGDVQSMMRMLETNREEEKLKAYLAAVDYEILLKLVALIHVGRDQDAGFPEKLDAVRRRREARSDLMRMILEQVPSCGRYFSDAVGRLQEEGVDVQAL
jgi:hypothetical protein